MEQIVRVKETFPDGSATVLLVRESACSGDCHKCSGCGAAKETMIFTARNETKSTKSRKSTKARKATKSTKSTKAYTFRRLIQKRED